MKKIASALILTAFIAGASLLSCADSESRMPLAGYATVVINLGMHPESETAGLSIIDRVLRLFTRDAVAGTAPANFSTIKIRITAPDIGSISNDFPPTSIITMIVPGGKRRIFDVTAYVAAGETSAALTFSGTTMADIPAGKTVNVPVLMCVEETKLVIPDRYNFRLVMMDGVNGANTITKINSDLGITSTIYPYDIDFDARGRIYFSNNIGTTGGIYQMETINSTVAAGTCVKIASSTTGVSYIAIDRKRNILYYIDEISSNNLVKYDLDTGTSQTLITGSTSLSPANVCVDEESGYLYISYSVIGAASYRFIREYDPVSASWTGVSSPNLSVLPFDILVKDGYLYESFVSSGQIVKMSLDLTTTIGTLTESGSNAFLGPHMFLAVTNRKLFVVDEDENDIINTNERVVSFNGIDGSGWEATATPGTFVFYSSC